MQYVLIQVPVSVRIAYLHYFAVSKHSEELGEYLYEVKSLQDVLNYAFPPVLQ